MFFVLIDYDLGHLWIRLVVRTGEDADEAVVVPLRNRIVLMVVTARASHGQSEKRFRRHIDFVMPFVGAFDGSRIVLVTPYAGSMHAKRRKHAGANLLIE